MKIRRLILSFVMTAMLLTACQTAAPAPLPRAGVGPISGPTGRGALVLAASDSPGIWKSQADYLVSGDADDELQIALDAGANGHVVIAPGHYTIGNTDNISSNTTLTLMPGAVLTRKATSFITLIKNKNWNNLTIGDTGIIIEGGVFDGARSTYNGTYDWYDGGLINLRYVANSQIRDAVGINAKDYSFVLYSSNNSVISNTKLTFSKGFAVVGGVSNKVQNVDAENVSYGVFIGNGATDTLVSDSKFEYNIGNIFFEDTVIRASIQRNILALSGNYSASGQQIYWAGTANDVSFIGNTFLADNITAGTPYLLGIDTVTSPQILVQGNTFIYSGVGNAPVGILPVRGTRIDGNSFRNIPIAVKLVSNVSITNNTFSIGDSTVSSGIIYTGDTTSNSLISGNRFTGGNTSVTYYIRLLYGTTNTEISNNQFISNQSGDNRPVAVDTGNLATGNLTFTGNLFQNVYYAIYFEAQRIAGKILMANNQWYGSGFADGYDYANFTLAKNLGLVTENQGTFQINAGSWGTSVTHGLSTNVSSSVQLTLTSNTTATVYVLGNITTTTFSANLSALQGSAVTGYWRAVSGGTY